MPFAKRKAENALDRQNGGDAWDAWDAMRTLFAKRYAS